MTSYKLSEEAKEDLIRIHHFGEKRFGKKQADKYCNSFFETFQIIAENPYAFESIDHIRIGYRRCPYGSDNIYFKVNESMVEIMAIIGRQEINSRL